MDKEARQLFRALAYLAVLDILDSIEPRTHHRKATRIKLSFDLPTSQYTGATMAVVLGDDQQVVGHVNFVDAHNNPARVDGVPTWASSDETIITVTPAQDGMSAVVAATGMLGTAQITVRADADTGSGVDELVLTGDIEVVAGRAIAGNITFDAPEVAP